MLIMLKFLLFVFVLFPCSAKADLFTLTLTQAGTGTTTKGFKSVMDIFDAYKDGRLNTILNGYDSNNPATGTLDFRGIKMVLEYDALNHLTFNIASLGINEVFEGTTQEESFKLFKNYLKKNQNDLLTKILKDSVAHTPYDAVAGNPSSLMA